MRIQSFIEKIKHNKSKAFSTVLAVLLVTFSWAGAFVFSTPAANALTLNSAPLLAESNPINEVFGSGTTDRVQGKVQEDIGTVQRKLGDVEGQAKGAAKQVKGRAQRDIGTVKNRADRAGDNLEDASDNIGDAVKDFFGQ